MSFNVLYLCPLGAQQRAWRISAAPATITLNMQRTSELDRAATLAAIADADVLISERAGVVDHDLMAAGKRLKLVHRLGSLWHDIDLAAARALGVPVCSQPMIGTIAVAENMMLQVLAVLRRAMPLQRVVRTAPETFTHNSAPFAPRRTDEDTFAFNWSNERGVKLLHNKTIGILGFGEIGAELARRLKGWNCRVIYNKRQPLPAGAEAELGVRHASPDALLAESDVLVSLLPYFPETDLWLNAARIARMKHGAVLCHAGSGSVIDEAAVAAALKRGHLAGASFDTFEWEPLPQDNVLLRLADEDANVFLLPHIGSCGDGNMTQVEMLYGNALRVMRGEALLGEIT